MKIRIIVTDADTKELFITGFVFKSTIYNHDLDKFRIVLVASEKRERCSLIFKVGRAFYHIETYIIKVYSYSLSKGVCFCAFSVHWCAFMHIYDILSCILSVFNTYKLVACNYTDFRKRWLRRTFGYSWLEKRLMFSLQ